MKRYKFMYKDGKKLKSYHGKERWKLNEWQHVDGEVKLCENGYHCSKTIYQAFSYIQGDVLAVVEVKGKSDKSDDKECYSDMRVIEAYKWTKKDSVALSIYAAELVIDNYEKEYPYDDRPRKAIEAARKVLEKDTQKNRDAAGAAAESAARAARAAARAAWSAARAAAWSAAESAAESARSAARSAAINKVGKWFVNRIKELEKL